MRRGLLAVAGLMFGVTAALATGCEGESKLNVVIDWTIGTVNNASQVLAQGKSWKKSLVGGGEGGFLQYGNM